MMLIMMIMIIIIIITITIVIFHGRCSFSTSRGRTG